jgi:ABC-type dipeptide/oligopeptide/nickel transport system permease component
VAIGVLQVAGITLAVFFVIRSLPADPVARLVGFNATPAVYENAKRSLGLDQSVWAQLGAFVGTDGSGVAQGDLGRSWVTGSPVGGEILQALPVTLELIILSFALALAIALPLGMATARRPGGLLDRSVFGYGLFAGAQPEFWWGLMFIFVFYYSLGWAPAPLGSLDPSVIPPPDLTGSILLDSLLAGRFDAFTDGLSHLVLPVMTLALIVSGPLLKMTRQSTARVLSSEYILYARASGLPVAQVARTTLRAALPPVVTLASILFGFLIGGAVLVEQVFALNGLGQYSVRSVLQLDFPALQATVLVITVLSLVVYLALDLLLAVIDPRVKNS